jgi:uncharacterized protein
MADENVTTIRDFYGAVARGDLSSVVLDPHIEWIELDVPDLWFSGVHHGPEAVLDEVVRPTFEKFEAFRVECERFLDAGDHIIVTGRFRGRAKTTGIALDAPFAHLWLLSGGRAVRFEGYTDTANWLYALYRVQVEHPVGV